MYDAHHYICRRSWLDEQGCIHDGPGGPLFDFLQAHPEGTLIINYDNFPPSAIVKFNSLLDETRSVDGVAVGPLVKVIGLMNPSLEDSYLGSDFYSRFDATIEMPDTPAQAPVPTESPIEENSAAEPHVIELYRSDDWEAILLGRWAINGQQFSREPGELIEALKNNKGAIRIDNAPIKNPDFIRFWQDMLLKRGISHQGRLLHALGEHQQISLGAHKNLSFGQTIIPTPELTEQPLILNSHTYVDFFFRLSVR